MIFSIKNDSKAPEHIAPGPCCFLGLGHGRGQLLRPPAGAVRALNRQDHVPAPGLGAQKAPGRGLCLCSILKTFIVYLVQYTKKRRSIDKYMGGGTMNRKDRLLQKQQAGRLPVYVKEDTNK